jgi:pimeloyl-ACP methyl ester carboxylesterase
MTMKTHHKVIAILSLMLLFALPVAAQGDIEKRVEHGYAPSGDVKIHYASLGKGPLIVMIHGFPDFWYTWRDQMEALAPNYQVVAIDQRGYNLSDKPKGVENYDMRLLIGDVVAVIKHLVATRRSSSVMTGVVQVAWTLATVRPDVVEKLIILNLPHLRALNRELATNPQQQKNSQYARNFQQEGAEKNMTAEQISFWVKDPEVKKKYIEAFKRSDFEAMLAYYKRNYPREPYTLDSSPIVKVKMPVLMIHGLGDTALLAGALNNTWDFLEQI